MEGPANTLPMMAGEGQFGPVGMGGMFTVLKVRDNLTDYDNPPEYPHPKGTLAESIKKESEESMENKVYVCRMLPEVIQNKPGKCPKCGLNLKPQENTEHQH